ncbi:hypothetical protein ACLESO_06505 [Pyxidicoccus sp. 3LG]
MPAKNKPNRGTESQLVTVASQVVGAATKALTPATEEKFNAWFKEIAAALRNIEQVVFTVPVDRGVAKASVDLEAAIKAVPLKPGIYLWYVKADLSRLIEAWGCRRSLYKNLTDSNKTEMKIRTDKGKGRAMKFSLSPLSAEPASLLTRHGGEERLLLYVGESGASNICGRLNGHRLGHPETGSLKLTGCTPLDDLPPDQKTEYDRFVESDRELIDQAGITSIICCYIGLKSVPRYRRISYEAILREALLPIVGAR